ncbi:MAG TPA: hypothetical protein VN893_09730 [Bryobacteraceae bacterium]|nr:hypothetical protein [Bryobacteraceae bacterium]
MTVPEVAHGEHLFWERVDTARQVGRTISGRLMKFFVQPTRADCVHTCTIDDLVRMLSYLPPSDWDRIDAILLRQPHRKQQTLASVWGRLAYTADFVDGHSRVLYSGPAIIIEAVNPTQPIKFGKRLSIDGIAELERLRSDGHKVDVHDKNHIVEPTLDACRTTQLYRTLLHEVGHWVDLLEKVERPAIANASSDCTALLDMFHNRLSREREQFAHAYADRLRARLVASQRIPFERQLDHDSLRHDNLLLQDFEPS